MSKLTYDGYFDCDPRMKATPGSVLVYAPGNLTPGGVALPLPVTSMLKQ
jgi:hypothetical protein